MSREQDHRDLFDTELFISSSLRVGVYLSALVIAVGLILLFFTGNTGYESDQFPTSLGAVLTGVVQFKPSALVSLGLLLLIATPVFRVAASVFLFLFEKDRLYTAITLIVFCVLLVSFIIGKSL